MKTVISDVRKLKDYVTFLLPRRFYIQILRKGRGREKGTFSVIQKSIKSI